MRICSIYVTRLKKPKILCLKHVYNFFNFYFISSFEYHSVNRKNRVGKNIRSEGLADAIFSLLSFSQIHGPRGRRGWIVCVRTVRRL